MDQLGGGRTHYQGYRVIPDVALRENSVQDTKGMIIRFTVFNTTLGTALLAATPRGICAVRLGDDASALEDAFAGEFSDATRTRDDNGLKDLRNGFIACLDARDGGPVLPLDLFGTPFQARVWEALRKIPRGETRHYSELAAELGVPKSTRAVARACATNGVAVLVPCHRVVPKSGGLGGYRWGVDRKAALLEREKEEG